MLKWTYILSLAEKATLRRAVLNPGGGGVV